MDLKKRFPRYSKLLRLYPETYRKRYGEQMLQTLADMLDNAPTTRQRVGIWSRTAADLPASLIDQQLRHTGEIMINETPKYVKNSALAGAAMLAPFFLLVTAASLDKNLRHSFLWSFPVLFIFFVVLPVLAFLLAATAFTGWLIERRKQDHKSWASELFDLHRNWHLLSVLIVGLGIVGLVYGHDSVHCITGNPVREARNWHQTWQCIQQR